jgi:cysteinyl-tRNA synthetase
VEFSFEALDEAAVGFQRMEHFLTRAAEVLGSVETGTPCADFVAAMDDDLGTPAAMAAIHEVVREGNRVLDDGASDTLRGAAGSVRAMLGLLGLDPFDPHWGGGTSGDEERLHEAVDSLVATLLEQRAQARAAKDFATADAIRDRIKAAGIEVEDRSTGSTWALR